MAWAPCGRGGWDRQAPGTEESMRKVMELSTLIKLETKYAAVMFASKKVHGGR